jgi:HEAT repeat protein
MKALILLLAALERPDMFRGQLELRGPVSNLDSAIQAIEGPAWAGYAVPMIPGSHHFCGSGEIVRLGSDSVMNERQEKADSRALFVLYRIANRRVTEIRLLSTGCRIDAGSRSLYWWEPVPEGESLRHLRALVSSTTDSDLGEHAVHALALHFDSEANDILDELASSARTRELRERAIFWLGAARGAEGFRRLSVRYEREQDSKLREEIVFAIHLSEAEGAVEKLVAIARKDRSADVRERALFWLSQRAGEVAARAIATAVKEDPDLEVKKQAVFALSQLPPEEGVPLLVEVAETHPHPEVKKQAFFWLGQSDDPRAIDLFEKVLLKK